MLKFSIYFLTKWYNKGVTTCNIRYIQRTVLKCSNNLGTKDFFIMHSISFSSTVTFLTNLGDITATSGDWFKPCKLSSTVTLLTLV